MKTRATLSTIAGAGHQVADPPIEAASGPVTGPHRDQLRSLRPQDARAVPRGGDDVTAGPWVLHATRL